MKAKEIEALEGYFKTENEHWNEYSFETICKAIETEIFSDLIILMKLYERSISIASETHKEKPFEGMQLIITECNKSKMSIEQKVFLFDRVYKYLNDSDFDDWFSGEIQDLLKSQITVYKKELNKQPEYNKPLTGTIRDELKDMMQKEIKSLPETLKELEPVQRLNIICKLIPFVLPKVVSVTHTEGELETNTKTNGFGW